MVSDRIPGTPARRTADRSARDRVLETAYELFSRHGVRDVGIDRIIAEAGVAKMSLYRHFSSKENLVLAFLDLRKQRWTDWLEAETLRRAETPADRLLTVFDALDEWFRRSDYEGCAFIRTVMEFQDPAAPAHQEAVRQLELVRQLFAGYAAQAGVENPDDVAYEFQILAMGAIVSASRGDLGAAARARRVGELLLDARR